MCTVHCWGGSVWRGSVGAVSRSGQEWLAAPLRTQQSMCDPAGVYSAGAECTDFHYRTTQTTHTRETEETVSLKTQINRNVVFGSIVTPIFNRRKEQMQ